MTYKEAAQDILFLLGILLATVILPLNMAFIDSWYEFYRSVRYFVTMDVGKHTNGKVNAKKYFEWSKQRISYIFSRLLAVESSYNFAVSKQTQSHTTPQ
jgi:hypothetical protein